MPLYDNLSELQLDSAKYPFRRIIHVADVTGSDAHGNGRQRWPYQNLSRAFQDVRSGFGDVVVWRNEGAGPLSFGPHRDPNLVKVLSKNDWSLVCFGTPYLGNPASRPLPSGAVIGPLTPISAIDIRFSVPGPTGFAVGDVLLLQDFTETGTARVNGYWEVITVNSPVGTTTLRRIIDATNTINHTQTGTGADQPYAGGDTGLFGVLGMWVDGCRNVTIVGLAHSTETIASPASGILFTNCDQVRHLSPTFSHAVRAYVLNGAGGEGTQAGGTSPFGRGMLEEGALTTHVDFGQAQRWHSLGIDGNGDLEVRRATWTDSALFGGNAASLRPIWYYGNPPREGALLTMHRFTRAALVGNSFTSVYNLAHGALDPDSALISVKGNYYNPSAGQVVSISTDVPTKEDREAQEDINQESIPQTADIVWGRVTERMIDLGDGTAGFIQGFRAYGGAIHYVEGSANVGTEFGKDGTESNPVGSLAAVLGLLADPRAAGLQNEVHVGGNLNLDANVDGLRFVGLEPDLDSVTFLAGVSNVGTSFSRLGLVDDGSAGGGMNGATANSLECEFQSVGSVPFRGVEGTFVDCTSAIPNAAGGLVFGGSASFLRRFGSGTFGIPVEDEFALGPLGGLVLDLSGIAGGDTVAFDKAAGFYQAAGMTQGTLLFTMDDAQVILDGTNTGGTIVVAGEGIPIDNTPADPNPSAFVTNLVGDLRHLRDVKKYVTNRNETDFTVSPAEVVVYEDDGTTELKSSASSARSALRDQNGNAIDATNRPAGTLVSEKTPV